MSFFGKNQASLTPLVTEKTMVLLYIWHWANCDWLHSQKNSCKQIVMVLLLWQVGLIANVKLHFFPNDAFLLAKSAWYWINGYFFNSAVFQVMF